MPDGYFVVKSPTYSVNYGLRGFLVDGKPDQVEPALSRLRDGRRCQLD